MSNNVYVVRNVRMPLSLDNDIRRIAEFEDRTISKVIQRLLKQAVSKYLDDKGLLDDETAKQRFHDILREADEIADALDEIPGSTASLGAKQASNPQ